MNNKNLYENNFQSRTATDKLLHFKRLVENRRSSIGTEKQQQIYVTGRSAKGLVPPF